MKILAIRGKNIASLEGEFAVDFTKEPLLNAGIFAITGPTGSGKSSLLDTMCMALFGKTPRLESAKEQEVKLTDTKDDKMPQNDPRFLLRRGTGAGYAEVDFIAVDGETYRARWSVSRAREKENGRIQDYRVSLHNLSRKSEEQGTKKELQNRIPALVGFSFEQFTRSVLLAQNDFSTFMKAKQSEKAALLEKLTGTEKYSVLSQAIYRKCNEARYAYEEVRIRMEGVSLLTEEEEEALKEELAKKNTEFDALSGLIREKQQLSESIRRTEAGLMEYRSRQEAMAQQIETGIVGLELSRNRLAEAEKLKKGLEDGMKELKPQLEEARRLDILLDGKKPHLEEAENTCKQIGAELEKQKQKLEKGGREALKTREELTGLIYWFEQNQSREMAAVRLPELLIHLDEAASIHEKMEASMRNIRDKKQQLASKKEKLSAIEQQLRDKKKSAGELEQAIQQMEKEAGTVSPGSLQKELDEVLAKREKALIEVTRFEASGDIKQMRAALTDGVPCPVCGSIDHPFTSFHVVEKMEAMIIEVAALTNAGEAIKKQIDGYHAFQGQIKEHQKKYLVLQNELAVINDQCQKVAGEMNVLSGEITHEEKAVAESTGKMEASLRKAGEFFPDRANWQENWKNNPEVFHEKLNAFATGWQEKKREKEKKEQELQVWASNRELMEANQVVINQRLSVANTSRCKIEKEWEELKKRRSEVLEGKPVREVEEEYNRQLDRAKKEFETLRTELENKTKQIESAKGAEGELKKEIAALTVKLEEQKKAYLDWAAKNEHSFQEKPLEASFEACGQLRNELQFKLKTQEEHLQQVKGLKTELEKKRSHWDQWAKLNDLAGSADGAKFRRIAQEYTLDILLSYANVQLKLLSGRYLLERVPDTLALQVKDLDMCNEVRTVHSLSGGESFLVSLALALGLSSLSSNQMNVESLFIDEGFGSLDSDTLRIAMDALESLRTQGRKIGVISHVQEMTERIPVRIRVCRSSNGRSSLFIDN